MLSGCLSCNVYYIVVYFIVDLKMPELRCVHKISVIDSKLIKPKMNFRKSQLQIKKYCLGRDKKTRK